MATARSTTNSDIHSQLNGYVTDYLTKHMYDANTSWPLRKTIRLPKQAELEAHYTHIRAQDEAIRNWAQQHHCETSEKTKVISNGIVRQTSQLIDSVASLRYVLRFFAAQDIPTLRLPPTSSNCQCRSKHRCLF